MSPLVILIIVFWFVLPIIGCAMKAKEKGHSAFVGIVVGGVLGLIGLLIYMIIPPSVSLQKKCPSCAETVKSEALICKHCGNKFAEIKPLESVEPEERTAKVDNDEYVQTKAGLIHKSQIK